MILFFLNYSQTAVLACLVLMNLAATMLAIYRYSGDKGRGKSHELQFLYKHIIHYSVCDHKGTSF